ncbi:MAG TPA: class I SAM-dependent methyltransferase [Candidatus Hydrogenedentes bacterium]|nr:class I SAM-dependent methyltransferase [Candidatus Hydrogenedentota bacterium]HIJ74292.1 class I SAM-dependent methyltransferase [Candidatus Hydrogenedentota bacterium]
MGCGAGRHADVFPGQFFGVDRNIQYVHYAKTHCRGRFLIMDAAHLAFRDNCFDLVFSVGVFHHLADEQAHAAASEMRRVTKTRGRAPDY